MIEIQTDYVFLKYKEPVPVRGKILTENRFLKVTVLEVDYYISVLPGFHNSTLEELAFKIRKFFSTYSLNFSDIVFSKKFFNLVTVDDELPHFDHEALFNIECILLDMLKKTHPQMFSGENILINDLYRLQNPASVYADSKCIKIKITPESAAHTIILLKELHSLNDKMIFRLDGNRFFELNELIAFEELLAKNLSIDLINKIDYIEEPFKNFYDTYLFQKRSRLRIAADESFSTLIKSSEENIPVVVKPSLFGISTIYNWMETHTKNRMIVSSAFEHPTVKIGLVFLAQLRPQEFHGLENLSQSPTKLIE